MFLKVNYGFFNKVFKHFKHCVLTASLDFNERLYINKNTNDEETKQRRGNNYETNDYDIPEGNTHPEGYSTTNPESGRNVIEKPSYAMMDVRNFRKKSLIETYHDDFEAIRIEKEKRDMIGRMKLEASAFNEKITSLASVRGFNELTGNTRRGVKSLVEIQTRRENAMFEMFKYFIEEAVIHFEKHFASFVSAKHIDIHKNELSRTFMSSPFDFRMPQYFTSNFIEMSKKKCKYVYLKVSFIV